MEIGTIFYGLQLKDKSVRYTFDTNGEDTLFVYSEEVDYVRTILEDRGIEFEII